MPGTASPRSLQEAATSRLLELEPGFRISEWLARGVRSNARPLIDGLRKAGLPE
jgi:adenylate cyclase